MPDAAVTGTVRKHYSTHPRAASCPCCPGPHCYMAEFVPDQRLHRHDTRNDVASWLHSQIYAAPDGARVTITVTVETP